MDALAAVSFERGIQLVDVRTGDSRRATGGSAAGRPNRVLFSPDGETVVSTHEDGTVTLWDVESTTPRETLRGHWNAAQQPVFSPDGDTLYTVSHDGTAIAWDLTGRRGLARQFAFTDDPKVSSEGFGGRPGVLSPDGRLIAVGLSGRGVALWDALELEPVGYPLRETGGEVKGLSFSPDGRTLAAVTRLADGALHLSPCGTFVRDPGSGERSSGASSRLQPGRVDARRT